MLQTNKKATGKVPYTWCRSYNVDIVEKDQHSVCHVVVVARPVNPTILQFGMLPRAIGHLDHLHINAFTTSCVRTVMR